MTVILVLTILMAGAPEKRMQVEVPSLEECLHNSREFLMKVDISKMQGAEGVAAACLVIHPPKKEDTKTDG